MVVMKRKQIMVVSVAALVAIAGYLSWLGDETPQDTAETLGEVSLVSGSSAEEATDVFSEARLEREIGRSESVASLQGIAADAAASAEAKQAAENEMLDIARMTEKESAAENLLRAKGYSDAVVYMADGKVTAVIKTNGLESTDVAKITEIIKEQTGAEAQDIKIVEAN